MPRVSENQVANRILLDVARNRNRVEKYSAQISSGLKVQAPGDTNQAGTVQRFRDLVDRLKGHQERIKNVASFLGFQDGVVGQVNDLLVRAQELATQGANETLTPAQRATLSKEVFQLRDQIVTLANSKYQDRYVYSGVDDSTPAYNATTYTNYNSQAASQRYYYNTNDGADVSRNVNVSDDLSMDITTPGNQIFDSAVHGLERLGRALEGFRTLPASGAPDGTGTQFDLPNESDQQTQAILDSLSIIKNARDNEVMPELISVASRQKRLQNIQDVLSQNLTSATEVLSNIQDADITEAASSLTQSQTALEASLTITTRILRQSILDFL